MEQLCHCGTWFDKDITSTCPTCYGERLRDRDRAEVTEWLASLDSKDAKSLGLRIEPVIGQALAQSRRHLQPHRRQAERAADLEVLNKDPKWSPPRSLPPRNAYSEARVFGLPHKVPRSYG